MEKIDKLHELGKTRDLLIHWLNMGYFNRKEWEQARRYAVEIGAVSIAEQLAAYINQYDTTQPITDNKIAS
jgi:hypothetical protein